MKGLKSLVVSSIALSLFSVQAAHIKLEDVTKDVTYLASDKLKGRGNFSPEIDVAANYIATRFKEIGLTTDANSPNFLQKFSAYQILPKQITLTLNNSEIAQDKIAMATSNANIRWNNIENVNVVTVGEDDDLRAILRDINQQGGNTLVLIHPKHQEMFARYQAYFNRGLTKLSLDNDAALVLALTDVSEAKQINLSAMTEITTLPLTNVVGILPGKSKANEVVLFSAHYDHLGEAGDKDDKIYNGADDDASGTTAVINLAEYYAKQGNNERTLMFAAFTAEEIGGFGSSYFSKQLNPEQIVAMINIEMIGKPSKFGAGKFWMTGFERSNLAQIMNDSLKAHGTEVYADPYPKQNLFYRSDNATLARLGVPAHSFSSTQLDNDQHYHKVSDDLDSLDLPSMTEVINTLAIGTESLIKGESTPSRVDTSKVNGSGKFY